MWAYFAHFDMPDDDPEAFLKRVRVDYPIAIDRALGLGTAPTIRLQRALSREGHVGPLEYGLSAVHWSWFLIPHGTCAYILLRHRRYFERSAVLMAACFDVGCIVYWVLPTAPPWYAAAQGKLPPVRRIMAEAGERFWGRLWEPLYHSLQGNPFAAMPSLHFGTSAMAARLLSQIGPGHGAVGWTYALTLGFGLVYLGEHYVVDLLAGLALSEALWRVAPRLGPLARTVGVVHPAARAAGGLMRTRERSVRSGQDPDLRLTPDAPENDGDAGDAEVGAFQALLHDRRKLFSGVLLVVLLVGAIYLLFPKVVGIDDAMARFDEATWYWVVIAVGFNVRRVRRLRGALPRRARRGGPRDRQAPARLARLVPDHDGRPGRHAHLLGRRRRRDRAHLLGAQEGRAVPLAARPAGWSPSSR